VVLICISFMARDGAHSPSLSAFSPFPPAISHQPAQCVSTCDWRHLLPSSPVLSWLTLLGPHLDSRWQQSPDSLSASTSSFSLSMLQNHWLNDYFTYAT
jgi:hypothetical protein